MPDPLKNEPAYPYEVKPYDGSLHTVYPGLTIRDWFAGQAISGLLTPETTTGSWDANAKWAYEIADALLAARNVEVETAPEASVDPEIIIDIIATGIDDAMDMDTNSTIWAKGAYRALVKEGILS